MTNSPHDSLFKTTFSQVEHAASELKVILPAALADRVDWSTLQLESGEYVDQELRHLLNAPNGVSALSALVRYTMEASDGSPEKIRSFFKQMGSGAEEAFVTAAEKLIEQERGKILVEGQVALLKRQLQKRFGPLPPNAQARLEAADAAQLERWADAVLDAESLEELLDAE